MDKIVAVKPGDLITADLFDQLLAAIVDLDTRLTKLEQLGVSTGVAILDATPSVVSVKSTLTVTGINFSTPTKLNIVTLGSQTITVFKDLGTDKQFAFEVPDLSNLDPAGSSVPLVVTNAQGSEASRLVTVKPFVVPPAGLIEVGQAVPVAPGMVASPESLQVTFPLRVQVTLDADYSATLQSSNSAFVPTFVAVAASQDVISPDGRSISFLVKANPNPGTQKSLLVQIAVAANLANGALADIVLLAQCSVAGNAVQAGQQRLSLAVGSPLPAPETRAVLSLQSPTTTNGSVSFKRGTARIIIFNLLSTVNGSTTATLAMTDPTGWTAGMPINNVPVATGPGNWPLQTSWTAGTDAKDTTLVVTMTNTTVNPPLTLTYSQPVLATN
jgi:hypothetical protein